MAGYPTEGPTYIKLLTTFHKTSGLGITKWDLSSLQEIWKKRTNKVLFSRCLTTKSISIKKFTYTYNGENKFYYWMDYAEEYSREAALTPFRSSNFSIL